MKMSDDSISDEDKTLFRQYMQTVKPLKKGSKLESSSKPKLKPIYPSVNSITFDPPPTPHFDLSDHYPHEVQTDTILSYHPPSIRDSQFRELRQGKIFWEGKLDLHGQKPDAAKELLIRYLLDQLKLEHRCVLIIHGKGGRHGEAPILKNLIYYWLQQLPIILAFHSALPKDGGAGALYVLLKRNLSLK